MATVEPFSPSTSQRPSDTRTFDPSTEFWPTLRSSDADHGGPNQRDSSGAYALPGAVHHASRPSPSSPEASHAKTLAVQIKSSPKGLKESAADCGCSTLEAFAQLDRHSSSWRTSQRSITEGWAEFSGTWPRAGTMRNGIVYQRKPLVRRTRGKGYLSLPTPQASDSVRLKFSVDQLIKAVRRNKFQGHGGTNGLSLAHQLAYRFGIYLHPSISEYLMGFPTGWTDLGASEMQSIQPSQSSSPGASGKP